MAQEFRLPDLGEGITEAQIIKVLIKEGDRVEEDQSLFEVETDKAAVEIPSPVAGVATIVHISSGQNVNVGDVMVTFDGTNGDTPAPAKTAASPSAPPAAAAPAAPATTERQPATTATRTKTPASPAVRKLARQMGVDIDSIVATGPGGRVTKSDVESASGGSPSGATPAPAPAQPSRVPTAKPLEGVAATDKWGATRRVPITQIRKTIAQQMTRSISQAVHVTHMDQADVTQLESMRREYNEAHDGQRRVTATAYVVRAVAMALRNHPVFNASLDMERGEIVYKEYINIGIAVDTERGLVVPNIRDADRLGIVAISEALAGIGDKARSARFAIEDLRGGSFTITNVGALGGVFSTPIINYPESSILGTGRAKEIPVVRDGQVVVRKVMPLSLSFDHCIADGAQAARFCGEIINYLEKPGTLLF